MKVRLPVKRQKISSYNGHDNTQFIRDKSLPETIRNLEILHCKNCVCRRVEPKKIQLLQKQRGYIQNTQPSPETQNKNNENKTDNFFRLCTTRL